MTNRRGTVGEEGSDVPTELERHYTPPELAQIWHLSPQTVRRWFEERTDVLKFGDPHPRGKHRHITIRIPASVAVKVYRERVIQ